MTSISTLSATQKEFLVEHVDGERAVHQTRIEIATRNALLAQLLIRYVPPLNVSARPECTVLTDKGRETLCAILADRIDALMRAIVSLDLYEDEPQKKAHDATPLERERLQRNLLALHRTRPVERMAYGKFTERPRDQTDVRNAVQAADRPR